MLLRPGSFIVSALLVASACASSREGDRNAVAGGSGGQTGPGASKTAGAGGGGMSPSAPPSRGGREASGGAHAAGEGSEDPSPAGATGVIPAGGANSGDSLLDSDGPCVLAPGLEGEIVVKVRANSDRVDELIQGEIHVSNASALSLPLGELELRYFLDSEYEPEETDALLLRVDHAEKSGRVYTNIPRGQVLTDVVLIEPELPGADAFLSIGFNAQTGLLLPGETLRVKFRIEPPNSEYYAISGDQRNDYSFGACAKFAALWPRVVLLRGSDLLSGALPEGFVLPAPGGEGGAGGAGMGGAPGAPGSGGADGDFAEAGASPRD